MAKIGRNQPCPCGSGRKYKHCCWHRARAVHVHNTPAESSQGHDLVETDLDRLSNSVVSLVDEGRLDEADAACEQLSASTSPTFKAGKTLKDTVNAGPRS